jgi:hypothetical protein
LEEARKVARNIGHENWPLTLEFNTGYPGYETGLGYSILIISNWDALLFTVKRNFLTKTLTNFKVYLE